MPLKNTVGEVVHGTLVRDPYRWLEDRNSPETEEWIRAQRRRCEEYFASCPELAFFEGRIREYLDVEVVDQPACVNNQYFYRKRAIGQEQGCICTCESGQERSLIDTSSDGKFTSVGIYRISADGALLAYEIRRGGEDRKEIRIVDVHTGAIFPRRIAPGYSRGLAFSKNGYFYCHETESKSAEHLIHYQSLGSAGQERVVFRTARTRGSRLVLKANAHRLAALWLHPEGSKLLADFWIADLIDEAPEWGEVFRNRRAPYGPLLCHDRILVCVETERNSSQLIELSTSGREIGIFVPDKMTPIRQIAVTRDRIFVSYLEHGTATIDSWLLSGRHADPIDQPSNGTIQVLPLQSDDAGSFFYTYESFDTPPVLYEHHISTNTSVLWHQPRPANQNKSSQVQRTYFRSKDRTPIPLTLVARNRDRATGNPRPVIMTSYGGFGVSMTPQYSVLADVMLDLGVVLALPHVRGGGEFGKSWHDAGRVRNRQAAFDDFIAAAEWLCEQRMTTRRQLAIFGGSNAGLMVAAVMTQRPELFRAVVCIAPLLDMVRYEAFDQAVKWRREYGTVEDPDDFYSLHAYSPYHHIAEDIDYPATLFVSGDKDDRCNPAHVRKMAALLEERPTQRSPVIVDYSEERGHSPAMPLSVRISALARRIAFLCRELEILLPSRGCYEKTRS